MAGIISKLSDEVVKRAIEETTQSVIEDGIRSGDGTNELSKRFFKAVLGDGSPLVRVARAIPGFRYAPNVVVTLAAEYLKNHADNLFQGDNRAAIQGLRFALKTAAPMLMGMGDATADVLEKQVGESVDRVVSPARSSAKKADIDRVVVVPTYFGMRPFFPVKLNGDGEPEFDLVDGYQVPRVLDATFIAFRDNWLREHPSKRVNQGGAKGQPQRVETISTVVPWQIYSLQEHITLIEGQGGVSEDALDALKKHFKPASARQEFSEETWAVFRAVVRTQRHFTDAGQRDQLDRQDFESLIEKFLKAGVPVYRVDQMIGLAFSSLIDAKSGLLPLEALRDFETSVDVFLSGEQDSFTKILRRWRDMRHSGHMQGGSLWWLSMGAIGATAVIWVPLAMIAFLILAAVYMAIAGVFTPLEGTQTLFGNEVSGKSYAFWMAFMSGWLAFATTWTFSIVQTLTSWVRHFYPSLRADWLVSLGHRISGFGLTVCSTMIPVAILLGASPTDRVCILAAVGFSMGMAFTLVESGWRYHVEESVLKASPWLNAIFGAGLLAYAFTHPLFVGHPDEVSAVANILGSMKDAVAHSKWLQLAGVLTGVLGASALVSFIEYRKVPHGTYRLRIRGVSLLLTLIVLAFVGHLFFYSPPKTSLVKKEKVGDVDVTSRTSTTRRESVPAEVPPQETKPAFDRKKFCGSNISFEMRERCKEKP
jgi:hypothetical protein